MPGIILRKCCCEEGCDCDDLGVDCNRCEAGCTPRQYLVTFDGVQICTDCFDSEERPDPDTCNPWDSLIAEGTLDGSYTLTQIGGSAALNCQWRFIPVTPPVIAREYDEHDCTVQIDVTTSLLIGMSRLEVSAGLFRWAVTVTLTGGARNYFAFSAVTPVMSDCNDDFEVDNLSTECQPCEPDNRVGYGGTATVTACV